MTPRTSKPPSPKPCASAIATRSLGTIVVAESVHGVVALFMGDDRAKLLRDLKDAFPEAEFVLDQTGLTQTIAKVIALVDAPHRGTDLAFDLRGSPVEMAVWNALSGNSRRRDAHLRCDRTEPADSGDGPGGRCGLRREPHCGRRALPSRREV